MITPDACPPLTEDDLRRIQEIVECVSLPDPERLLRMKGVDLREPKGFFIALHQYGQSFVVPPPDWLEFYDYGYVPEIRIAGMMIELWSKECGAHSDVCLYLEIFIDENPRRIWVKGHRIP